MLNYGFIFEVVFDVLAVAIHSGSELVFGQAYVLSWAFFTLELINYITGVTGVVSLNFEVFISEITGKTC